MPPRKRLPVPTSTCATPTCTAGVCGTTNTAKGAECTGGVCDGNGACAQCLVETDCAPTGTKCETPTCAAEMCGTVAASAGTLCDDDGGTVCDSSGKCVTCTAPDTTDKSCGGATCPPCVDNEMCKLPRDCQSGLCESGICTACTSDGQCQNNSFCDLMNNGGTCTPTKPSAAPCTSDDQCASAFCADKVCCDQACTGTCMGCTQALTGMPDGTCSTYTPATPAPSGQCAVTTTCGNDGNCAAGGVCEQAATTTSCGAASCMSGVLTPEVNCDGTGNCPTVHPAACSGNFACASSTTCGTSCSSSTDCAGGAICCGGACVVNDANNCGTCGHTCQGGTCSVQTCQPVVLATLASGSYPTSPVVVGSNIYWAEEESSPSVLATCNTSFCKPYTLLTTNGKFPNTMTGDASHIYYFDNSGFYKTGLGVGTTATLITSSIQATSERPGALVVDATNAYWCNPSTGEILQCSLAGCTNPIALFTSQDTCAGIAVDSKYVYWTIGDAAGPDVQYVSIGGGTAKTIASSEDAPDGMALDASGNLYWAVGGSGGTGGAIMKCAPSGCPGGPTALISNLSDSPEYVLVDATQVYWLSGGGIYRAAIGGGTPVLLAGGLTQPSTLAQDAASIYWADESLGTINKIAK